MASQYTLQLKAILDSTQVQQELQKLRQQQQAILGGGNGKGTANNLGNLGSLSNTLLSLKTSIDKLNQSIASLNSSTKVSNTNQNNKNTQPNLFGGSRGSGITQIKVQREIKLSNIDVQRQTTLNTLKELRSQKDEYGLYKNYDAVKQTQIKYNNLKLQQDAIIKRYGEHIRKLEAEKKIGSGFTPEMKRMLGGMAVGVGIDAFTQIGSHLGMNQGTQNLIQGLGTVGQYAVMGSAAGPWGAAIGGIIGGAQAIATALSQSADIIKESAEAFKSSGKEIYKSALGLDVLMLIERKNKNEIQSRLDRETSNVDTLTFKYEQLKTRLGGKNVLEYTEETARLMEIFKIGLDSKGNINLIFGENVDVEAFKNGNKEFYRNIKNIQDRMNLTKQIGEIIPEIQSAKANKSSLQSALDSLTIGNTTNNSSALDNLKNILMKLVAPNLENVNSLASQGVMINRADDSSREQSIIDYQKEQTDLQRQIRDLVKDSGTIIQ